MDDFKQGLDDLLARTKLLADSEDRALREIYGLLYRHQAGKAELLYYGEMLERSRQQASAPSQPAEHTSGYRGDPEHLQRLREATGRANGGGNADYYDEKMG